MALWMVSMALSAEPIVVTTASGGPAPLRSEVVLSWAEVGLRPAVPESPAIGPNLFAVGPAGSWAVYSPVGHRILTATSAWPVSGADGLAFTESGMVVVMDDRARVVRIFGEDGEIFDSLAFPAIVPAGGTLALRGATILSIDAFGNGHPLATVDDRGALRAPTKTTLVAPSRRVTRSGASVVVDGRTVATVAGKGGARLLGDWLLVESLGDNGASRAAIPLDGGAALTLPVRGRLYAPAQDASAASDGSFGWMDPRTDGLHVVVVTP